MRATWNQLSATYQARQRRSSREVYYGPWAPTERELQLLGDTYGRHILDLGCGGGQNTIALARQGALAVGLDISDVQLTFARTLATVEQSKATFIQGSAEQLGAFQTESQDCILSVYTFPYLAQLDVCLAECGRVLRAQGRLLFSLDHPLRDCFFDSTEDEPALYPVRSYFDNTPLVWTFPETNVVVHSRHATIAQWLDLLARHGFQLRRLVEPLPPQALLDEVWPADGPYAALRNLPQTIIFLAEKT